jgi:hypothetical protein
MAERKSTDSGNANQAGRYGAIEQETGRRICADKKIRELKVTGTTALAIFWALACHRPNIRPGIESLAKLLSVSRAKIERGIRALEEARFIRREHRPGFATTYELTPVTRDGTPDLSTVTDDGTPPSPVTGPVPSPVTGEDKKLKTRRENKKSHALAAFSEWYAAYPKHVARASAAKAFSSALERLAKRHDGNEADALAWLMERTRMFAAATADQERHYIAYPATWLNGERYDDDPAEWQRTDSKHGGKPNGRPTTTKRYDDGLRASGF